MKPSTGWLSWPYYNPGTPNYVLVPNGNSFTVMADVNWDMAQTILQDLKSQQSLTRFLTPTDPQYMTPIAYAMNLIAYAESLLQNTYAKYIVPAGWDPAKVGLAFAQIVFATLAQIPVNASDPNTVDVFTAWTHGTGNLYGGHPPITDVSPTTNPSTGQSSAPAGSIL